MTCPTLNASNLSVFDKEIVNELKIDALYLETFESLGNRNSCNLQTIYTKLTKFCSGNLKDVGNVEITFGGRPL